LVTTVAAEAGTDVLTANPPLIIARAIAVAIMVRMGHSFDEARFQWFRRRWPVLRVTFAETPDIF